MKILLKCLFLVIYVIPESLQTESSTNGDNIKTLTLRNNKIAQLRQKIGLLHQSNFVRELTGTESEGSDNGRLPIYEICLAFLKEFGKNAADFIQCSVENARPFRFCESCVKEYTRAITIYNDILQDDEQWSSCRDILLKADRIQVLRLVYSNIMDVWQDAFCDGCFKPGSISEQDNGTVVYEYSDIAKRFNLLFFNATSCIKEHSNISIYDEKVNFLKETNEVNKSVCTDCLDVYRELNKEFKDAMKKHNREVCMDLVDMMNYTRIAWGLKLKCTKYHTTNAGIITISIIVAMGTIAFYVVTGVTGSRKQKKLMKQKRMSDKSAAVLYGATIEIHNEDEDNDRRDVFSSQNNTSHS